MMLCHYCGRREAALEKCPDCGAPDVRYVGAGTEKVMAAATALFPGARIARMDGETLKPRGAAERIYHALRDHEIDVLVGTQVIAKGIDIPGITTIGVVNADTALLLPDFRSAERTFQLLCQVAGRAGRGDRKGTVIIQTFEPAHYAVTCAARHDQNGFARQELEFRRASGYPPFGSCCASCSRAKIRCGWNRRPTRWRRVSRRTSRSRPGPRRCSGPPRAPS